MPMLSFTYFIFLNYSIYLPKHTHFCYIFLVFYFFVHCTTLNIIPYCLNIYFFLYLYCYYFFLDLLQLVKSEPYMPSNLKSKLSTLLSLLVQYTNNKKEINNHIFKLLDSSYVNILEAQQLSKQIDVIKTNAL